MITSELFNTISDLLTERDKMVASFAVKFMDGGDIRPMYDRMEKNEAEIFAAIKAWSANHRPEGAGDGDDNKSSSVGDHSEVA